MTVAELMDFLRQYPGTAEVVINGQPVHATEIMRGKIDKTALYPHFWPHPKGKQLAVTFTRWAELSDGNQYLVRQWNDQP